ncbi:amidohydrolase [uncultured Tateyamaria sp.]|uniref:amidohydrolase family protein n=1 Tax=uncultured Tateyamaria sp. TaxID=455651 RepID=UPI00261657E0|nr:amidohydrolase family protein [uncultured Tateyamaria sp.]
MKIDAHQHYWQPARGDYDWMPKDIAQLNRAYAPRDLVPHLAHHGIDGTVLIQAAATVAETEYMLGLADATTSIKAVVGWIDFQDESHRTQLERFAAHPKFRGVRPMIQDIPDVNWMLRDDVQWAYAALVDLGLTFDALGFPQHIANFLEIAERFPEMQMVVDHCMKPQIRDQQAGKDAFSDWAAGMTLLADRTRACVKLSALLTEADHGWNIEDIRPFARHVLDAFGPDRVMWGSDWPVCRLRSEYDGWLAVAQDLTSQLSDADRAEIFGGTAIRFYRLD